jgi:pimeloyl-ACP methyl ester carboxylesterase
MTVVRRAFADLAHGQVHYRYAGIDGPVVVLLHAGPGSAKQLEWLAANLAARFRIIVPDMPGNGDSEPLSIENPTIADYAAALVALLDTLGLDRVHVYGTHTGASIAAELAIGAPGRVGQIVMDGLGVFAPARRDEFLAHYAHPFTPDLDGAYLLRAFHFLRDQYLFFPWYDRTSEGLRDSAALPPPRELHAWLVEVLKAAETYPRAYRAAFSWPAANRLPLVPCHATMTAAANDPLHDGSRDAASWLPDGRFVALPRFDDPGYAEARSVLIANTFA